MGFIIGDFILKSTRKLSGVGLYSVLELKGKLPSWELMRDKP